MCDYVQAFLYKCTHNQCSILSSIIIMRDKIKSLKKLTHINTYFKGKFQKCFQKAQTMTKTQWLSFACRVELGSSPLTSIQISYLKWVIG